MSPLGKILTNKLHPLMTVAAVCVLLNPAFSAEPVKSNDYTFKVMPDRAEPLYRKGEEVSFTISLTKGKEPGSGVPIRWKISKDGVEPPLREGVATLDAKGTAVVTGKLDEPGFLQCRADCVADGARLPSALGGAAVDQCEIKPSLPPPDDFDAFWAAQKKRLAAIPLNLRLTPVKSNIPGVECFDAQADSVEAPLSAYLARPLGAKPKSLPAILTCHGAGVGSSQLNVVTSWAKEGFLALDFNAHGLPNGKPREFYENLYKGELSQYYLKNPDSREKCFFLGLFCRLMRAIEVLASQPEWDGKIIVADGRSQGGGQAIAAAGLDPRVTFFAAQIPALCDHTGLTAGRISGWPKLVPIDANGKPDENALQASRYFDAVNFAGRTKAGAFFTVGFIDVKCPPTTVYAAYNNVSGPKKIHNHFTTGHVALPEGDALVHAAIMNYLKAAQAAKP